MSLQLPAILSPPTSCIPALALTVSCRRSGCRSRLAPSRVGFRFWASPFPSRLANASGRIVFNMVLFMDWQFASGCSPPRLSTTQLPSTTDSQCSVRWGLSPHCWCALSGALRDRLLPVHQTNRQVPPRRGALGYPCESRECVPNVHSAAAGKDLDWLPPDSRYSHFPPVSVSLPWIDR